MAEATCSIVGCEDPKRARGLCNKHYLRAWFDETLDLVAPLPTPEDRFWAKVDVQGPSDCWPWTAGKCHEGYGRFRMTYGPGVPTLAHRISYELCVGPIPDGLHLDHLCRNTSCVNPAHLEPVTSAENTRRGFMFNAQKTRCKHGHPFDDENTGVFDGKRYCKECRRRWGRESMRRRRSVQ